MNDPGKEEKASRGNARNTGNKGNKVDMSLVRRLTLRMMVQTLFVLLFVNLFLFAAVLFSALWDGEEEAVLFMQDQYVTNGSIHVKVESGASRSSIISGRSNENGLNLWQNINRYTPLKDYEVTRSFFLDGEDDGDLNYLTSLNYRMDFYTEALTLSYPVGSAITKYIGILHGLLIFEALVLILGIRRGSRKIRRILSPLSDLTRNARNLKTGGSIPSDEMRNLRKMAGTISSIDATKLDRRLPVDGPRNELTDLSAAINKMLNRIDEAYRSQAQFVSDASHELRTPIAVIQGYANLLDRWGKNDPDALQESIDAIKSEAESMKDLVEQLLFLARGDNETMKLYPEEFDSLEMVKEILQEAQMIDSAHTFRIKGDEPAVISADPQLVKQALRILVDNSIKYTPENGEIIVSVSTENKFVRISVQDNGIGIDPKNLPYIFDRFYRSDESRARKTGGSGLGLAIMKWIIDRHGGKIEVISRKDIGTRTTILLPLLE